MVGIEKMTVSNVVLFKNGIKSPSRRDGGPYDFHGFLHMGVPSWQDGLLCHLAKMACDVKMACPLDNFSWRVLGWPGK